MIFEIDAFIKQTSTIKAIKSSSIINESTLAPKNKTISLINSNFDGEIVLKTKYLFVKKANKTATTHEIILLIVKLIASEL